MNSIYEEDFQKVLQAAKIVARTAPSPFGEWFLEEVKRLGVEGLQEAEKTKVGSIIHNFATYVLLQNKEGKGTRNVTMADWGAAGGRVSSVDKAPFKVDYRSDRDKAPEKSRASIINDLCDVYDETPLATLEKWAKEADDEDDFPRKVGRPKKIVC